MNIELLREIGKKATDFPEAIDMYHFGKVAPKNEARPCGAVACIAGTEKARILNERIELFISSNGRK